MQAKSQFTIRNIGNIFFILPENPTDFLTTDCMLTTNQSGALLWKYLQQPVTMEQLTASFQDTYQIDKETASQDIRLFLQGLQKIGAI